MKKKILLVLTFLMLLTACSSMSRTDVVDVLNDKGYVRNSSGAYVKKGSEGYDTKIAYVIPGITQLLIYASDAYSEGPVLYLDYHGSSYYYFINDDLYGVESTCNYNTDENSYEVTNALYYKDKESWYVGSDACELFPNDDTPAIKEFFDEQVAILDNAFKELSLSKKALSLLKD